MKVMDKNKERIEFHSEDEDEDECLSVYYDNRGDPYSQGITIELKEYDSYSAVYLEKQEALRLVELIINLYGDKGK